MYGRPTGYGARPPPPVNHGHQPQVSSPGTGYGAPWPEPQQTAYGTSGYGAPKPQQTGYSTGYGATQHMSQPQAPYGTGYGAAVQTPGHPPHATAPPASFAPSYVSQGPMPPYQQHPQQDPSGFQGAPPSHPPSHHISYPHQQYGQHQQHQQHHARGRGRGRGATRSGSPGSRSGSGYRAGAIMTPSDGPPQGAGTASHYQPPYSHATPYVPKEGPPPAGTAAPPLYSQSPQLSQYDSHHRQESPSYHHQQQQQHHHPSMQQPHPAQVPSYGNHNGHPAPPYGHQPPPYPAQQQHQYPAANQPPPPPHQIPSPPADRTGGGGPRVMSPHGFPTPSSAAAAAIGGSGGRFCGDSGGGRGRYGIRGGGGGRDGCGFGSGRGRKRSAEEMMAARPVGQQQPQEQQPMSKKGQMRMALSQPIEIGPVVVRQPATEEERQEVARWIADRKRFYPTSANVARKQSEAAAREESGGLDPQRDEHRKKLREVLERQRVMGLDRMAGTSDMHLGHLGDGGG
ncbi:hypothetical protein VaNZ11_006455, partial [Volvox africanus]